MLFLNRVQELSKLDNLFKSKQAALVILYGRRRIGKTRLLLEWLKKHRGLYWVADESSANIQRYYFAVALEQYLPGFSEVDYPDWHSFFSRLAKDAFRLKWRGPLVIDEFPYLATVSKDLPSILQRFVDHDAKQANLLIILSGSSQQMMQGLILDPKAPLYGRAQEIIKISPMSHIYIGEALKIHDRLDQFKAYSIWGGIPRYWELASLYKNKLLDSINNLVLDHQGILYDEPNRLLLEEIPSAMALRPLLDAIGSGMHRLSEIAGRLGQPVTSLSRSIDRLKELDFIEREIPFGASEINSKCALYKIKDPFLYFWFHVVAAKKSLLAQLSPEVRLNLLEQQLLSVWAHAWEVFCRNNIHTFINKHSSKFDNHIFEPAKRFWHGNQPEWDIVANSLDRKALLLGGVKWSNNSINAQTIKEILLNLLKKGMPIKVSKHIEVYYVICVSKKPKNIPVLSNRVLIVDIKDLFVV